jgi:hypothetical protein
MLCMGDEKSFLNIFEQFNKNEDHSLSMIDYRGEFLFADKKA